MKVCYLLICTCAVTAASGVELQRDDDASQLTILVDGREAVVYQYAPQYALPHYWPIRSPSGKLLTVQHPDPYPHHRSLWIADKIQAVDAPPVDFYHCWKNYREPNAPNSGFRHFIRHQQFGTLKSDGNSATIEATLRWIVSDAQPVLDEHRRLRVVALGASEVLIDLTWEIKASYGDVRFLSDKVHYAWPFVRMHPQFSGEQGGTITNDRGRKGQSGTNGELAQWVDYSNTVDGTTEGLTVFVPPDDGPRAWLTREYGTFGPRRLDKFSGGRFMLKSSGSLSGRVGILVHRGDVESGRVAQRYQQYIESKP